MYSGSVEEPNGSNTNLESSPIGALNVSKKDNST